MIKRKINEKNVENFLLDNLDFFVRKPEILKKLTFPKFANNVESEDQKIVSYKDWVIQNLTVKQKKIIENVKHNYFTQKKVLDSVVEILKKKNLDDFISFLTLEANKIFDLEVINIVSSDADFVKKYNAILLNKEQIGLVHNSEGYLIMDAVDHNLEIFKDTKNKIYSNAIFSLDMKIFKSPSLLVFGSKNEHFLNNKAYDLIIFFSKVVEEKLKDLF